MNRSRPAIRFLLDGRPEAVDGLAPTTTVLEYLRESLGRHGTKEGCAEGDCGACTVLVAGLDESGRVRARPVNACLQFLPALDGRALYTVESLRGADGALHPVQQALLECHASQCGFCTPGFVMALLALYKTNESPGRDAIDAALAGNLCRCTGYRPIIDAARRMYPCADGAGPATGDWLAEPCRPGAAPSDAERVLAARLRSLDDGTPLAIGGPSAYFAPRTLQDCATLALAHPGAVLLAGGTDAGLWVTQEQRALPVVIELGRVPELVAVGADAAGFSFGAAAPLDRVFAVLLAEYPELAELARRFGGPAVRGVATLGGNLGTASPVGDLLPVLMALDASVRLRRGDAVRELPVDAFVVGYRTTALRPGELIEAVRVPRRLAGTRFAAFKLARRRDQDIAAVTAAFRVTLAGGVVTDARVACGGMGPSAARARACEAALGGGPFGEAALAAAAPALARDFRPIDDHRASARFREAAAANLLRRFLAGEPRLDEAPAAPGLPPAPRSLAGARHESAHLHVTGEAAYVDDLPEPRGTLHAAIGTSPYAHAAIRRLDLAAVRAAPGVVAVLTAADVPGVNDHGPIVADDPIFATDVAEYAGQSLFAVVATSAAAARRAARLARIDAEEREPVLDVEDALARGAHLLPSRTLARGDADAALRAAPHRLRGALRTGGQDHFYLEGQVALAVPREDGQMLVHSSTQHPSEVQALVARALGVRAKDVVVECRRLGGGFGGKETQAALFACIAAVAARRTGRPVKLRVDRRADMRITGKRHDYLVGYDVGFDDDGRIHGVALTYASRCGRSADLSGPVNDRTMFHADNAYWLEHVRVTSHRLRTNTASNTAFRGFGGPQGMIGIETVLDDVARHVGLDPLDVRRRNFYGTDGRNVTPYGMTVEDNIVADVVARLEAGAHYRRRREEIARFNRENGPLRRGLALTPVKFGIAFTATHYNQAGALVHVYRDGTVMVNHGGTEMGQGLHTKVAQVVARELGVPFADVRCTATDTSKVPNTSATAASASSDLNGRAAQEAARSIRVRLAELAAARHGCRAEEVVFRDGRVHAGTAVVPFAALAEQAWLARVSLSATGFHRTPKIGHDPETLRGRPFHYFCYGAAVSEAIVDVLTGESRLLRVDILHDAGRSLNPAIDVGQVEGGFLQGVGWLTCEELAWDAAGRLRTDGASTYKIPACSDWPREFNVELLDGPGNREDVIYRSKAVGEPPLMLALSAFFAIKDAVAATAPGRGPVRLDAPATPESVLRAIAALRDGGAAPAARGG